MDGKDSCLTLGSNIYSYVALQCLQTEIKVSEPYKTTVESLLSHSLRQKCTGFILGVTLGESCTSADTRILGASMCYIVYYGMLQYSYYNIIEYYRYITDVIVMM